MKGKPFLLFTIILLSIISLTIFAVNTQGTETTYVYTSKTIYINEGEGELFLRDDLRSLNLFPNSSWQTTYLLSVNQPYTLTSDSDQNQILLLNVPQLSSGKNATLTYSLKVVRMQRQIPNVSIQSGGNLSAIPREFDKYLGAEGSWQVDNKALRALAEEIWLSKGKTSNVMTIVSALADWIGNNISPKSHEFPLYPNETYALREGDCDDQANLLITLCRILNVPAYLQIGFIRNSVAESKATYWDGHLTSVLRNVGFHGWAVIYIPPWGWLPFDMTLGWKATNSLEGITSAVVWRSDTVVMLGIVKSDWAGGGRWQKDYVISNALQIYAEDSVDLYNLGNEKAFWENPVLWMGASAIIISVGGYLTIRKFSKRPPTNKEIKTIRNSLAQPIK